MVGVSKGGSMSEDYRVYSNDRQYLGGWDRLYKALVARINVINREAKDSIFAPREAETLYKKETSDMGELNRAIINEKERFRKSVKAGIEAGRNYAMEGFSKKFGLSEFEKFVVLTYISFDTLGRETSNTSSAIIKFLCYHDTFGEKIKKQRYFLKTGNLLKYNILLRKYDSEYGKDKVSLNSTYKRGLYAVLSGDLEGWDKIVVGGKARKATVSTENTEESRIIRVRR
jgi:hypothetical protein